jgi:hypothetical protein
MVSMYPTLGVTRGSCSAIFFYPNDAYCEATVVLIYLLNVVIPLTIMVYCYTKIIHKIRVVSTTGEMKQGDGSAIGGVNGASSGLARGELNIAKTMITQTGVLIIYKYYVLHFIVNLNSNFI